MAGTHTKSVLDSRAAVERVAASLRHAIAEGTYAPHAPMPSYRDLAKQNDVSLWAVRAALDLIEREGLVERHERRGTFVRPRAVVGTGQGTSLQCINVVQYAAHPDRPPVSFMESECLVGYTQALDHTDTKLRFASLPLEENDFAAALSPVVAREAQGCILRQMVWPELFEWLHAAHIPFVVQYSHAYSRANLPPHHSVFTNKTRGAFDATKYLLGLGHRRIGFIGELTRLDCVGRPPSYDGYRAALACEGIEPEALDVMEFSTDHVGVAREPARSYLCRDDLPTAVLAQTDSTAMALLEQASAMGLRVPDDLSVVGINDQPESAFTSPPLTTISTPRKLLARTAVEMLMQSARGDFDEFQVRALECHLVVRKSVGPPRHGGAKRS